MEILFWVIVAVIVLAIIYGFMNVGRRKESAGREPVRFDVAPNTKEHGIDLQARRKLYDDVTAPKLTLRHSPEARNEALIF